jgi:predicted dehydrogenase
LTEAAVRRGVAVLVEKPVVADAVEAAELGALDGQGIVVPAHILRSGEPYLEARRLIVDGGLRIGALSARRHRGIDHLARFPDQDPVFMSMVHDIDLAVWFTGSRAVTVRATGHAVRDPARIDTVLATVVDAEGRTWDLGSSWTIDGEGPGDRFEVYTDRRLHVVEGAALDADEAMRAQYARFAAVLGGEPAPVSVAEAVHGIAIAEAVRASIAAGGTEVAVADVPVRPTAGTAR